MMAEERKKNAQEEHRRSFARVQEELKQLMIQNTPTMPIVPRTSSSTSLRNNSNVALDAAVVVLAKETARILVRECFVGWRHEMQRRRLEDAETSLQEQDRLVQFLSQELVNDTHEQMMA